MRIRPGQYIKTNFLRNPYRRGSLRFNGFNGVTTGTLIKEANQCVIRVSEWLNKGNRMEELNHGVRHNVYSILSPREANDLMKLNDDNNEVEPEPTDASKVEVEPEPEPDDEGDDGSEVRHGQFHHIARLAGIRQNILLCGPSGSGKTFLGRQIADHLGLSFAAQSCSAGMSESQLAGWLLPVGDSGKFSYVPSPFVNMYENGGVFLFDEVDAADENTMVFINAALAGDRFYLPQRFEKPEVKKHPDFVAMAAANTFGLGESATYAGRNRLDGATLDRFRAGVVMVDYSAKVERRLVDKEVYGWCSKIRTVIKDSNLDRIMSTRVMLDLSKQKRKLGYGPKEWTATYLADWSEDEKRLLANFVKAEAQEATQRAHWKAPEPAPVPKAFNFDDQPPF